MGFPLADKSAVAAIHRALRGTTSVHTTPVISLKFIIGSLQSVECGFIQHVVFLYSSIDDTNVLLTAGEGGSRYREYSFVRDPSLAEELEYAG